MKHSFSFSLKIVILFLLCVGIVSCGDDTDSSTSSLQSKVLDDFSMSIPASWPLVSKDSEGIPDPSSGEVVLIASATEPKNNVANNVVVLKRPLSTTTTDKQYALASKTGLKQEFYTYSETESGDIIFTDGTVSHYSVFQAEYNKNTPRLNYLQTVRICNAHAFTITMTLARDITDFNRYKDLVATFSCNSQK